MLKLLLTFLCIPFLCFCREHVAKKFTAFEHSYICFDGHYFIHDPDCGCYSYRGAIHKLSEDVYHIHFSHPPSDM
jgi:hypothetical protein